MNKTLMITALAAFLWGAQGCSKLPETAPAEAESNGNSGAVPVARAALDPNSAAGRNAAVEPTRDGDLIMQPLNHSALRFEYKARQYYIDPAGQAPWSELPKADVIIITHSHGDHLSMPTINQIRKEECLIFASAAAAQAAGTGTVLAPGESRQILDITLQTVPAYNLSADRLSYHPRDRNDIGCILTFGDKRVYVAGDTEGTPEMKALKDIDVAFLPINLPYTMNPQEAAEAARLFKPKVLYPYHQGRSDPAEVKRLLADVPEVEVRVLALP